MFYLRIKIKVIAHFKFIPSQNTWRHWLIPGNWCSLISMHKYYYAEHEYNKNKVHVIHHSYKYSSYIFKQKKINLKIYHVNLYLSYHIQVLIKAFQLIHLLNSLQSIQCKNVLNILLTECKCTPAGTCIEIPVETSFQLIDFYWSTVMQLFVTSMIK